jgi:putative transposase
MRKSKFTAAQQHQIVLEQAQGKGIEEICRTHQISAATFHKWKDAQRTAADENKRRIDQLEKENKRLKKLYTDLSLDHDILKEGYEILKKIRAQSNKNS